MQEDVCPTYSFRTQRQSSHLLKGVQIVLEELAAFVDLHPDINSRDRSTFGT